MNNFKRVSVLLAQHAEEVARYLLPEGKKKGHEWCVGSVEGESGKSLKVCLSGPKSGLWCDFATGDKGDLIDLWVLIRKIKPVAALKEAEQYLGIPAPKFEAYRPKNFIRPSVKIAPLLDQSSVMQYLINERKLTTETLRSFQIGEKGRSYAIPYVREGQTILVKHIGLDRVDGKKQIHVTKDCEPCLFGWHMVPGDSRAVRICEGEIDAMSLYQYGLPALSVPFGAGAGDKQKWVENEFDRLSVFDEIFLCFDMDEKGSQAVNELVKRLGRHRCRVVSLPFNDANECLQKGVTEEEMHKCFNEARTLDPEELKPASSYVDEVIGEFYPRGGIEPGYSSPWEKAKGKILFRPNELSILGGINGHGKSQVLGHIVLHSMKQGARVCIASLEIKPKKLLMRLTRQASGVAEPEEGYIRAIHQWYGDQLWLFDLVGTAKTDRLLEVFLYANQRYGIDLFVIDSFMKCGIDEDDFKAQKAFIEQVCDFKNEHDCHVIIIVHPRKSTDETQMLGKLDCKGTGAITDLSDNCFTVWRNKSKEELVQRQLSGEVLTQEQIKKLDVSDAILRCDKQRNGDWEGKIGLWFDQKSYQYLAHPNFKPVQYVDYSACR